MRPCFGIGIAVLMVACIAVAEDKSDSDKDSSTDSTQQSVPKPPPADFSPPALNPNPPKDGPSLQQGNPEDRRRRSPTEQRQRLRDAIRQDQMIRGGVPRTGAERFNLETIVNERLDELTD